MPAAVASNSFSLASSAKKFRNFGRGFITADPWRPFVIQEFFRYKMCPSLIVTVFTDSSNKIVTRVAKKSLNISKHPWRKNCRFLFTHEVKLGRRVGQVVKRLPKKEKTRAISVVGKCLRFLPNLFLQFFSHWFYKSYFIFFHFFQHCLSFIRYVEIFFSP